MLGVKHSKALKLFKETLPRIVMGFVTLSLCDVFLLILLPFSQVRDAQASPSSGSTSCTAVFFFPPRPWECFLPGRWSFLCHGLSGLLQQLLGNPRVLTACRTLPLESWGNCLPQHYFFPIKKKKLIPLGPGKCFFHSFQLSHLSCWGVKVASAAAHLHYKM